MKVLIVGGGVGGLALAVGLRDVADVTLVEQAAAWKPVGAALLLHANAMAALRMLKVDLGGAGEAVRRMVITDAQGWEIGPMDMADFPERLRDARVVHRADLHRALVARTNADVKLQTSITALEGRRARLTDGTESEYDVIVGADGIHSRVRGLVYGAAAPRPTYLGYTCWRWIAPNPGVEAMVEMWGRGQRVGLCPLGDGRIYGFLVQSAPAGTLGAESADALRARFAGFGGQAPAALAALDAASIRHDDLYDLDDVWWGRGTAVLLGDAAHAQTPNLGQGAAAALEDGVTLAAALRAGPPETAIPAFIRLRTARVRGLQKMGRRLGAVAQWESPLACAVRDWLAWMLPASANAKLLARVVEEGVDGMQTALAPAG